MQNITDALREQIASQNLLAARRAALILKCEWETWKTAHAHRGLMQRVRWEHGHA